MKKIPLTITGICAAVLLIISCSKSETVVTNTTTAIEQAFGTNINLNSLANYANQEPLLQTQKPPLVGYYFTTKT
jgi:hypothetical protein